MTCHAVQIEHLERAVPLEGGHWALTVYIFFPFNLTILNLDFFPSFLLKIRKETAIVITVLQ